MNLSQTTDMSWELQPLTIWSSLESTIAIICASLPALRPLVSKAFPKFFSTLSNHSYDLPSLEHQNTRTEFSGNRSSSDFVRVTNQGQMRDAAVDLENGKFDMQAFGAEQSERSSAKDLTLVEACGPLDEKSNAAFRGQSKKSRNLFESEGPNKL
jgi:hypothetical protein